MLNQFYTRGICFLNVFHLTALTCWGVWFARWNHNSMRNTCGQKTEKLWRCRDETSMAFAQGWHTIWIWFKCSEKGHEQRRADLWNHETNHAAVWEVLKKCISEKKWVQTVLANFSWNGVSSAEGCLCACTKKANFLYAATNLRFPGAKIVAAQLPWSRPTVRCSIGRKRFTMFGGKTCQSKQSCSNIWVFWWSRQLWSDILFFFLDSKNPN